MPTTGSPHPGNEFFQSNRLEQVVVDPPGKRRGRIELAFPLDERQDGKIMVI